MRRVLSEDSYPSTFQQRRHPSHTTTTISWCICQQLPSGYILGIGGRAVPRVCPDFLVPLWRHSYETEFGVDAQVPWDTLGIAGAVGGVLCSLLCVFVAIVVAGIAVWRLSSRTPAPAPAPPAPPPPPLSSSAREQLGYREQDGRWVRERWGRWVRFQPETACWSTPVEGRTLRIAPWGTRPAAGEPPAVPTRDPEIDAMFVVFPEHRQDTQLFTDPDLKRLLVSMPSLHLRSNGQVVEIRDEDNHLTAYARKQGQASNQSDDTALMNLHNLIADVLVLTADRVG